MRNKFVIGNWKMHTNAAQASQLAKEIADGIDDINDYEGAAVAVLSALPLPGV